MSESKYNFRPIDNSYKLTSVPITYSKCSYCGRRITNYEICHCRDYQKGYNQALSDALEVLKVWEDTKEKFIEYLELKIEVQKKITN